MDWQSIVVFSVVFWSTYHLFNCIKDWQRHSELTRVLRDMDKFAEKLDKKFPPKNDDKITRVK